MDIKSNSKKQYFKNTNKNQTLSINVKINAATEQNHEHAVIIPLSFALGRFVILFFIISFTTKYTWSITRSQLAAPCSRHVHTAKLLADSDAAADRCSRSSSRMQNIRQAPQRKDITVHGDRTCGFSFHSHFMRSNPFRVLETTVLPTI